MNWTDLNESMLTKLWGKQWWIEYISWCKCVWTLVSEMMYWQRQPFAMLLLSYLKCDFSFNFMFYFKLMLSIYQGHYKIQFIYSWWVYSFHFLIYFSVSNLFSVNIFNIWYSNYLIQIINSFKLLAHSNC